MQSKPLGVLAHVEKRKKKLKTNTLTKRKEKKRKEYKKHDRNTCFVVVLVFVSLVSVFPLISNSVKMLCFRAFFPFMIV